MAGPHYVTERLLKEFRGDDRLLYELNRSTTTVAVRNTGKAGAEVDIWPDEIERAHLQNLDNKAHRLIHRIVSDPENFRPTGNQREAFIEWLFVFIIRVPSHRELTEQMRIAGERDGTASEMMLADIALNAEVYLADFRSTAPEYYRQLVADHGQQNADALLLDRLRHRIVNGEISIAPNSLFHQMLKSGRFREQLHFIRGMNWTWLQSCTDFIIGDNPFCRSKRGLNSTNYGLQMPDLEVLFPISRHLCLWMHRQRREPMVLNIRDRRVYEINRRQIENAHKLVWGPNENALRPPARPTL